MMGTHYQQNWVEPEEETAEQGWPDPQRLQPGHRLQHQVELQSQRIEQVLSRHHVPADVSGGSVRPHWVSFDLVTHLSDGWDRLRRLTGELTAALGVPEVRLDRHDGRLRLSVKRFESHPVDLLDLLDLLPEVGAHSLALGLDHQGCPVMLNLAQKDLHNVLITGISGAGKSSLMRTVAVALALTCRQSLAQLAVVSVGSAPSGITSKPDPLVPVNYLPHMLFPLAGTLDDAVDALAYLVDEAAYRAETGINTPTLIILIDDADMLLRRAGGATADHLAALLHAPVESGLRVIIGAANPELPDLRALLQHNADLRIVGRMADERSALAAAGREGTYAQYLEGKGDFLAVSAAGVVPFQAAYIDDYDLHLTLTELHRASDPVLLAQQVATGPTLPPFPSSSESKSFTYDGVSQQASFEPDDRSGRMTFDGDASFDQGASDLDDLSWMDNAGRPAITLIDGGRSPEASEDCDSPGSDGRPADATPKATAEQPAEAGDLPIVRAVGPRLISQARPQEEPSSPDEDDATDGSPGDGDPDDRASVAQLEARPAEDLPGGGKPVGRRPAAGNYQMLPFDRDSAPDAPAGGVSAGAEPDPPVGGQAPSAGAQVLWPVEPTYTDIDDDMWDTGDLDDDDWRKRLH
ncbi:MAG TPA: hypothetical protein VLE70_16735 [Anaerolineae bacterium]|nr:hypothetical protein [Anaerolineae bacterium]